MVTDHGSVAAAILFGIFPRTAEDFCDEVADVSGMVGGHIAEDRADEVIFQDLIVKGTEEALKGFFAPGPFI